MRRVLCLFLICLAALGTAAAGDGGLQRLFTEEYDFWDCDWSPDGRYLALAGKNHNQPAQKARIWLSIAGKEKPVPWTNTDAFCDDWPRWSPEGKRLVLVRRELATNQSCLWLKDVGTGAGRRLTKGPDDRQPSWSPDGKRIVFRRGDGPQQSTLAVFETETGQVRVLPVPPGLLGEPSWGRDGIIYYTRYQVIKRQTTAAGKTYEVQVIAGGRLWRYDPATGQGGTVLNEDYDQRMPTPSPDGRWLAFYGQREAVRAVPAIPDPTGWALYLRDQSTGKIREVVANVALTGGPPNWSPDAATLTFYSLRSIRPALWSCPTMMTTEQSR